MYVRMCFFCVDGWMDELCVCKYLGVCVCLCMCLYVCLCIGENCAKFEAIHLSFTCQCSFMPQLDKVSPAQFTNSLIRQCFPPTNILLYTVYNSHLHNFFGVFSQFVHLLQGPPSLFPLGDVTWNRTAKDTPAPRKSITKRHFPIIIPVHANGIKKGEKSKKYTKNGNNNKKKNTK